MSRPAAAALCVFGRAAVAGRVKSRLARTVGATEALRAHRALVDDTLARLARVSGLTTELCLDDVEDASARAWAAQWQLPLSPQSAGDLGARMHHALARLLDTAERAILVGTDCPSIDAEYVRAALAALDDRDVVLGPAEDGGYGLIGMRRPQPGLFTDVPWGGPEVLAVTRRRADAAGLAVALLPEIWDVDDAAGWERFRRLRCASSPR